MQLLVIIMGVTVSSYLAIREARISPFRALLDRLAEQESDTPATKPAAKRTFPLARGVVLVSGAALFVILRALVAGGLSVETPIFVAIGLGAGELTWRALERAKVRRKERRFQYYLPTVMERVVMAVTAGLDIHPALVEVTRDATDPVSERLKLATVLCDRGLSLQQALEQVAASTNCRALEHAFLHLGLAHAEGGELVRPLRELSDATYLLYQESIEEEIAKLPATAVLPLVVTFAGLIICFLTVPLVQVGTMMEKAVQMEVK